MSSLRLSLDDTDFDALFESAQSVIPVVAPDWTDHNLHDPGITLIDLLAWSADQQIYALGRMRMDERLGYAAMFGLRPTGPVPARGLLWPEPGAQPLPTGIPLPAGTEVSPTRDEAPGFLVTHGVYATPVTLVGIRTVTATGQQIDWPSPEPPRGNVLLPLGADAARGARLELILSGILVSAPPDPQHRPLLSIGFRTEEQPNPTTPQEVRRGLIRARLQAELHGAGPRLRLPIIHDQTAGFTQSGILLVDLAAAPVGPLPDSGEVFLRLTLRNTRLPVPPRLSGIALNVLPVHQEKNETLPDIPIRSTALPDQELLLDAERTRFGKGVAPPKVSVAQLGQSSEWRPCDDLSAAGPTEEVFVFDTDGGIIRFGNGVNGKIPPAGAVLQVSCLVCEGSAGNLPADSSWHVRGTSALFRNPEPMHGGADRVDIAELRRQVRQQVGSDRPLVTNSDLEAAALACIDLRVARAHVIADFDPQRRPGHAGPTRTLVVVRADSGKDPNAQTETTEWLRALRRRLAPRLTVGDRVRIVGPRYLTLRLRATVVVAPNRNDAAIVESTRCLLQSRLAAVPAKPGDPFWLLGRDVSPRDLKGWLRRLDGVVALPDLRIGSRPARLGTAALKIPPDGLPLLVLEPGDIVVHSAASEVQS